MLKASDFFKEQGTAFYDVAGCENRFFFFAEKDAVAEARERLAKHDTQCIRSFIGKFATLGEKHFNKRIALRLRNFCC